MSEKRQNFVKTSAPAPGTIVVAETLNHRIQVFNSAGTHQRTFGSVGSGNGQFIFPIGVAVGPTGTIVVADSENDRIQMFEPVLPDATLCATLGDDTPPSRLDQDLFHFTGTQGETVALTLEALPSPDNTGDYATLVLLAAIRRVRFVRTDSNALPATLAATLPATGRYLLTVLEQPRWAPGEPFSGDYCVTLQASAGAWQTLEPTAWTVRTAIFRMPRELA
jgi:DNA-binding beta-propeller fold protein YncE